MYVCIYIILGHGLIHAMPYI